MIIHFFGPFLCMILKTLSSWVVEWNRERGIMMGIPSGSYIAIEHGPPIGDLPTKDGDFPLRKLCTRG